MTECTSNNFLLSILFSSLSVNYVYQQRVLVIEDWYQEDHLKDEAVQKHHRVEESIVCPTKKIIPSYYSLDIMLKQVRKPVSHQNNHYTVD